MERRLIRPPKPRMNNKVVSLIGSPTVASLSNNDEGSRPRLNTRDEPPKRAPAEAAQRTTAPRATKRARTLHRALRASTARDGSVRVLDDELGKMININVLNLERHGWSEMVRLAENDGDLRISGVTNEHPATPLLQHIGRSGVPVKMETPPWTQEVKDERFAYGSHNSCREHLEFLREEMLEFAKKGFWLLLPYSRVREMERLRLSPMGIIPQRDRRPRLIIDYSHWGVNDETAPLSPNDSMQFGRTLERCLYTIRHANPRFGPVHLAKVDLSDGFYRERLNVLDLPHLGSPSRPTTAKNRWWPSRWFFLWGG